MHAVDQQLEHVGGWDFPIRLSSVHCADDPFHQEHSPTKSSNSRQHFELQ